MNREVELQRSRLQTTSDVIEPNKAVTADVVLLLTSTIGQGICVQFIVVLPHSLYPGN